MKISELVKQGYQLKKTYDFRTIEGQNLEEFTDSYMWDRTHIINNEAQYYLTPTAVKEKGDKGAIVYTPFTFNNGAVVGESNYLSITAFPTPDSLKDIAIGLTQEGRDKIAKKGQLSEIEREVYAQPQPLCSGLLTTRDRGHSQLFGYFEFCMRLPNAKGAWPAAWLLPTFERWPEGIGLLPEFDVMELMGLDPTKGVYTGTLHDNPGGIKHSSKNNEISTGVDLSAQFHVYGFQWTPRECVWYFDGEPKKVEPTPKNMRQEPMHLLVNLAAGGWAGEPDLKDYPASLGIRYISVYGREEEPVREDEVEEKETKPEEKPKEPDIILDKSYPGDVIDVLKDGRVVTARDVNLITQWLDELSNHKGKR